MYHLEVGNTEMREEWAMREMVRLEQLGNDLDLEVHSNIQFFLHIVVSSKVMLWTA